jgi:hypothetical protein
VNDDEIVGGNLFAPAEVQTRRTNDPRETH